MKTFIAFATCAVAGLVGIDTAHPANDVPASLTVQLADLDLRRTEGAIALFNRILDAARRVCSTYQGESSRQKQQYATCVEFALSNAVVRVDRPLLLSPSPAAPPK